MHTLRLDVASRQRLLQYQEKETRQVLMAKILHCVNSFDPSADVIRCVKELNKYSRHRHTVIVKDPHPVAAYGFEQVPPCTDETAAKMFQWADAVIYQFVGYEKGWGILPHKSVAFRNINIYYDQRNDKFWSEKYYNAGDLTPYKLTASSHIGAADFLPKNFRLLPDLIPIYDDAYMPDWTKRSPCISYIKHEKELDGIDWKGTTILPLLGHAHSTVLSRRQKVATCVIDNVCDGHVGLAGIEAMSLGLTTVVFNHEKEKQSLQDMGLLYPPFVEVKSLEGAIASAIAYADDPERRRASRQWMEQVYYSKLLIDKYWDPFVDELLS